MYVPLASAVVTLLLRDWVDTAVILGVVLVNAIIGFVQESKAIGAIAALQQTMVTEASVLRAGEKLRLPADEMVPGGIVVLASGDKVPADLRLLHTRELQVNESALTGESLPVEKSARTLAEDTPLAGDPVGFEYDHHAAVHYMLEGEITLRVGDENRAFKPGDVVYFPQEGQVVYYSTGSYGKFFYVTYPHWR